MSNEDQRLFRWFLERPRLFPGRPPSFPERPPSFPERERPEDDSREL